MLQVCAHNVQCVCVCVCLCTQNLQLCAAEEGSHKMMGISKLGCSCWGSLCIVCCLFSSPLACTPFCYVSYWTSLALCSGLSSEKSHFTSACNDYPWKHNSMHDWCICVWSTLWIANMADISKWSASSWYSSGETCSLQCDWLRKAAPPNSHEGSGAEGGGDEKEIEVGVETQHLLTAATDKLQRIQSKGAC